VVDSRVVGWGRTRSAVIVYEYLTPDLYVGSRICPTSCADRNPKVYLKRYPKDAVVTVHFDPANPSESYLELPSPRAIWGWKALSGICLSFPLVFLGWIRVLG
jgi:hypothetical protein